MSAAALDVRHMAQAPKLLLRGSQGEKHFFAAVEELLGLQLPSRPNSSMGEEPCLLWLSPTGWLLVGLKDDMGRVAGLLQERLAGRTGDAIDVSDEYEHIRIEGGAAAELMATVSPFDLCPAVFTETSVARILAAGVPAIIHRPSGGSALDIYVDRTYLDYLMGALKAQAQEFA